MAQKNANNKTTAKTAVNKTKDATDNKENQSGEPSYLEKFFTDQLKDIYYAEKKILEGLDKMIESATTDELKDAFKEHHSQTEKHVKRLEKVFGLLNKKPREKNAMPSKGF